MKITKKVNSFDILGFSVSSMEAFGRSFCKTHNQILIFSLQNCVYWVFIVTNICRNRFLSNTIFGPETLKMS